MAIKNVEQRLQRMVDALASIGAGLHSADRELQVGDDALGQSSRTSTTS